MRRIPGYFANCFCRGNVQDARTRTRTGGHDLSPHSLGPAYPPPLWLLLAPWGFGTRASRLPTGANTCRTSSFAQQDILACGGFKGLGFGQCPVEGGGRRMEMFKMCGPPRRGPYTLLSAFSARFSPQNRHTINSRAKRATRKGPNQQTSPLRMEVSEEVH